MCVYGFKDVVISFSVISVAPTVMTPPGVVPRYTMAATPVTNYHLQSAGAWLPQQYIAQPPVIPVSQHILTIISYIFIYISHIYLYMHTFSTTSSYFSWIFLSFSHTFFPKTFHVKFKLRFVRHYCYIGSY